MEDRKAINKDFRIYLKSKEQLVGIIKSMTDKLLDDKLTTTFQQQQAEVDKTIAEMQARGDYLQRFNNAKDAYTLLGRCNVHP